MELYLVRHGETEWSRARGHTSRTDVPLSPAGEAEAEALGAHLATLQVDRVLSSPLSRAVTTARLAGFGDRLEEKPLPLVSHRVSRDGVEPLGAGAKKGGREASAGSRKG